MELTGQCKEDFEKWYELNYEAITLKSIDDEFYIEGFQELPESFKYGVYVDFFDSVGVYVSVSHNEVNRKFYYDISTKPMRDDIMSYSKFARQEAREQAITKANELYNARTTL